MHSIAEISKPRRRSPAPDLLDPRIIIRSRRRLACERRPVLVARVLERQRHDVDVLNVLEFLGVAVGQEKEVWSGAFCYGHAAVDWADAWTGGTHHGDFETVGNGVEVLFAAKSVVNSTRLFERRR